MNYKKIYNEHLFFAEIGSISNAVLLDFFADNPYKYVYLTKNKKLTGILDKESFSASDGTYEISLFKDYVCDFSKYPTTADLNDLLKKRGHLSRFCILVNGEFKYELVHQNLFDIPRGTLKDLIAIRHIDFFSSYIKEYFLQREIKSLLWIGGDLLFKKFKSALSCTSIYQAKSIEDNYDFSQYDIVFDAKYFDLLPQNISTKNLTTLHDFMERIVLQVLISKAKEQDIQLLLLHLPDFKDVFSFLTSQESKQATNIRTFQELLNDEEYLNSFVSESEKEYLLHQDYQVTSLFDDGEKIIQSNINSYGIYVKDGIRKSISCVQSDNSVCNLHLLGTCTAFGMCSTNNKTIASHLQNLLNSSSRSVRVFNRGVMQGRFLLNSLISAFMLKLAPGDKIVILDYFEGYIEDNSWGIVRTSHWFEFEEKKNLHCFWDYPAHCNSVANKIFAQNIYNLLLFSTLRGASPEFILMQQLLPNKPIEKQFSFNPSVINHMRDLENYSAIPGAFKGLIIMYACPFTKGHQFLVEEALKIVDHLFVFVVAEYFHGYQILDRFDMVRDGLKKYNNVTVLQTETYFATRQYFPEYGQRGSDFSTSGNLELQEILTDSILCKKLNITHRFIGDELEDKVTASYNKIVEKYCKEYGITCVIMPRAVEGNEIISAKTFRKYLEKGDIMRAKKLVPDTTIKHIFTHIERSIAVALILHDFISEQDKNDILTRMGCFFDNIKCIDDAEVNQVEESFQIKIHYGLHGVHFNYSSLDFFINGKDDVNDEFVAELLHYCQVINKKTMLYLGKFPGDEGDMDGGSQLSYQLIESLKNKTVLDLCFIRKGDQKFETDGVHNISYVPYINPYGNKFQRRLENLDTNKTAIKNGNEYDLIIAAHCSKLFGLQDDPEIMEKSVIFPMFLTQSYKRANEDVPVEYTTQEQEVLKNVSQILTPSSEEKDDMVNFFSIPTEKIRVIPRGISPVVASSIRNCTEVKLISIGSVKEQKNHIDDIRLLELLISKGIQASLVIAGSVYDEFIMQEMKVFIKEHDLKDKVSFVSGLNRQEISALLSEMTFGISNSRWETFGRGIFECLASGLPTLVSDSLTTVQRLTGYQKGISFHANINSMADMIISLYKSPDLYQAEALGAIQIAENFSFAIERERLLYALIFDRFNYVSKFTLWDLQHCEKIYDGRYSVCYRNNGHVRKYLNYKEAKNKAIDELQAACLAYTHSLPTPEPHFAGYDCKEDKFFIDYTDRPSVMCNTFSSNELIQLEKILDHMRSLPVIKNNWSKFSTEFIETLRYYELVFCESVDSDIQTLKNLQDCCFIHGDFWRQNIGVDSNNKIVIFDFQNSGNGPENWDRCYLYANIPFKQIQFSKSRTFSSLDLKVIQIILKIRISRLHRKNMEYSELIDNLNFWRELEKNNNAQ